METITEQVDRHVQQHPELFNIAKKNALAKKAKENLYIFCRDILKYQHLNNPLHHHLCNILDKSMHDRRRLYMLPRGHLKTSIITIGDTLRQICINPEKCHCIINATAPMAESFCSTIADHIEGNDTFNYYFPHIRPKSLHGITWGRTAICVNRKSIRNDNTVEAYGIDTNIVGSHPDRIVFDDLVNKDNSSSIEKKEELKAKYQLFLGMLKPGGNRVAVGTRWFYDDLYQYMLEEEEYLLYIEKVFHLASCKAEMGEATCSCDFSHFDAPKRYIFPKISIEHEGDTVVNGFDDEEMDERRRGMDDYFLSCQYFNVPVSKSSQSFKKTSIQFYEKPPEGCIWIVGVDLSVGKRRGGDSTTLVTSGMDYEGNIFIPEYFAGMLTPSLLIEKLLYFNHKYSPALLVVETQGGFGVIQDVINEHMSNNNLRLPLKYVTSPTVKNAKKQRILNMEPKFSSKKVYFHESLRDTPIIQQLLQFPAGKDDIIDGLAWSFLFLMQPNKMTDDEDDEYVPIFKRTGW